MGNACSRTVIDSIPDKAVMLQAVDRIVAFEEMLKKGESLSRVQEGEKRDLDAVARAMKRVQRKEKWLVRGVTVRLDE